MKKTEKTSLDPCDIVVVGFDVYRADARIPGRSCASQCHLYDEKEGRCRGLCYRFDNLDDIVFRRIMPVGMLSSDATVVVTPMWREWEDARKAEATGRQEAYRERKREGAEPRKVGRKSTGGIEEPKGKGTTYRAQIIFDGKRYRYASQDKAEVEAWLEGMRKGMEKTDKNL